MGIFGLCQFLEFIRNIEEERVKTNFVYFLQNFPTSNSLIQRSLSLNHIIGLSIFISSIANTKRKRDEKNYTPTYSVRPNV